MEETDEYIEKMSLEEWGKRLECGWVRVATHFIRSQYTRHGAPEPLEIVRNPDNAVFYTPERWEFLLNYRCPPVCEVMPLRYVIEGLKFSKSQRQVLRKNSDLSYIIRPYKKNDTTDALFEKWYEARFGEPHSVDIWLKKNSKPFQSHEIAVYDKDKLIACSFFDDTPSGNFSAVACFDPDEEKRSLGTFTLLLEVEYTAKQQKHAHYPGTALHQPSCFDYKKRFNTAEYFDWETKQWTKLVLATGTSNDNLSRYF